MKSISIVQRVIMFTLVASLLGCDSGARQVSTTVNPPSEIARLPITLTVSAPSSVTPGETISMAATLDYPDGVPPKVSWRQINTDTPVMLSSTTARSVTFTAPVPSQGAEILTFEVTAYPFDKPESSVTKQVVMDVFSFPLTINSVDRDVNSGDRVSLHGKTNTPSQYPLTVLWTQLHGTPVTLDNENTLNPTFTAPDVLVKETLLFSLQVETAGSRQDVTSKVTVNPPPVDPIQIGGVTNPTSVPTVKKFLATPDSVVTLTPLQPLEAGNTAMWVQLSGAPITIENPSNIPSSFIMPHGLNEPVIVRLTVTDSAGSTTATDQAIYPASEPKHLNTTSVISGSPVTVHSTTPSSGLGDSHAWIQVSGPKVTLENANTDATTFTAPTGTTPNHNIVLQHTITPPDPGLPTITTHTINLVSASAVIHRSLDAYTGSNVTVHADGVAGTTYTWEQIGGPQVQLNSNAAVTMFTAPSNTAKGKTITLQSKAVTELNSKFIIHTINLIPAIPPLSVTASAGTSSITSGSQGGFNSSVTGGTPPYTYTWSPMAGPTITLDETVSSAPTFTAPAITSATQLAYTLTVTDADMNSQSIDVSVTLEPQPISIQVYQNKEQTSGDPVGLHASAVGGVAPYSYNWLQKNTPPAPSVVLNTNIDYAPVFTAPNVTEPKLIEFEVTVTDSAGSQAMATEFVRVTPLTPPTLPKLTVSAPPQLVVNEGASVNLSVVTKGGDGTYSYSWLEKTSGFTLNNPTLSTPSFIAPMVNKDGTLSAVVTVTDGSGNTESAPISILVRDTSLHISAGKDITLVDGHLTSLHALITHPSVPPYTYTWSQLSGGAATIIDMDTANPSINLPDKLTDTYEFSVTVTDGHGEQAVDNILLSATFALGADAGRDQTVTENSPVSLHGIDVGGLGNTSVKWTQLQGSPVNLVGDSTLNPTFISPITATNAREELVFQLVATDSSAQTASDTLSVYVEPVLPKVSIAASAYLFENSTSSLTAVATGGTPPYTFNWTRSGDIGSTITSPTTAATIGFTTPAFALATAHDMFEVTVTDGRGHTSVASHGFLLHAVPPKPVLTLAQTIASTIVSGGQSPAMVSVTGASQPLTFSWADNTSGMFVGGFSPSATVQNPSYTAPLVGKDTSVDVRVTVGDSVNASATSNQSVLITAVPMTINVNGDTTVLRGQTLQLHADISGGIPPYLLLDWKDTAAGSSNSIGKGIDVALDTTPLTPGDYKVNFAAISSPPATSIATKHFILTVKDPKRTLTVPANANLKAGDNFSGSVSVSPSFAGESFTFTVSSAGGGPDLSLSSAKGINSELSANDLVAGVDETYTVTATLGNESLSETFTIKTPKAVVINAVTAHVCSGVKGDPNYNRLCGLVPAREPTIQCDTATPYAMNTMENTQDGKKTIIKRCAAKDECETLWWQQTSDETQCTSFDPTQQYLFDFTCHYCCTTDNCNKDLFPVKSTLYIGDA